MDGYVAAHRKMLDNPIVCKDADHLAVWMYLLLNAVYKPTDVTFHGERITLRAGQLTTGRKVIADKFKISESKVQRILKSFENEHQIEQLTDRQCRLITIVSWNEYQVSEQRPEQRVNNDRTTSEQRVNTKEESNKYKKENKNNTYVQEFERLWALYPKKQGKKKACENYIKARKSGATSEEVEKGIIAYAEYIKATNTEDRYIKHGSTFFSQQAWQDEWRVRNGTNFRRSDKERSGLAGGTGDSEASGFRFTHSV
ncbi:MAG: hypothetical protein II489_06405 [Bacteroidaceae bacterium]|nr:hypothetical protein [Bacteroidaceae bacterium]